ncbi:MAG: hypothetical protein HOO95_04030 [Gallionella sp.]|nr:hypothetical protein [Gallionella sp.]
MFRTMLPKVLLVFALLFAQLGSLTHGISHTFSEQNQSSDQSLQHDKHCDLCAVYAQIGSAIGSNQISFHSSENIEALHVIYFDAVYRTHFTAFAARAPPYST